ncbi:MAG TPA: PEGA domain-containing protein, partial [Kofleriaceae bacterium]|nr:PEGA domain-containing protein [Kofleriaceae bacterium]
GRQRTVLRVESSPSGAAVRVNGDPVGVTPLTTTVAGATSSTVTLSKPGFKTVTRQITPTTGSARMSVTFKPEPTARRSSSRR